MKSYAVCLKIITFIRGNLLGSLLITGLLVALIKLYGLYTSVDVDDGRWQQFKIEHHCNIQNGEQGSQRLSWKCDDGKVYFSWRQQR